MTYAGNEDGEDPDVYLDPIEQRLRAHRIVERKASEQNDREVAEFMSAPLDEYPEYKKKTG